MEVDTEAGAGACGSELLLLDRVFLRLGNADSDEQLEDCLAKFLSPVILKLCSPHESVRTKVMELLVHVNKRVKCRSEVQLPVQSLLHSYRDPAANNFVINFTIIYLTMGFPRLSRSDQLQLVPELLHAVEHRPPSHQDGILVLIMPLLGEIKVDNLKLKEKPKLAKLIISFATDVLLLPYRALPSDNKEGGEFQVPPGMSLKSYKRITGKNVISATQLEEMKLSIVNFLSKDVVAESEMLLPLIVAAADSRFSIANQANSPLIRVTSSVDWSSVSVCAGLYALYLGTWGGRPVPAEERKVPACTRLRLKLLHYLNRATGPALMFPHSIQVIFTSLFDANSNSRLRNLAISFVMNVINNGDESQLAAVSGVLLEGLLKLSRADEMAEHRARAYACVGRLARRAPACVTGHSQLLEELMKKLPEAAPELKTALRDALLEMAPAYRLRPASSAAAAAAHTQADIPVEEMDTSEASTWPGSSGGGADTIEVDETQALALFALLDHYMHSEESMIRYVATRYAAAVFPARHTPAKYLLLLASGDSQDEIINEALKCLYGTARKTEIEDVVNNVSKKESTTITMDQDDSMSGRLGDTDTTMSVPTFHEMVEYIWEQQQKRKKGSNTKHRFVLNNQVLSFHPHTYQEMLRYLRMCLNQSAGLQDCSEHPNASSPALARYITHNLLDTPVLEHYLNMITSLLQAAPDLMPLKCFLDIIGCVPDKMAAAYTGLLPFLKNLLALNSREEVRELAAVLYAIITAHTQEKQQVEREIEELVQQANSNKSLESQCGYASALSNLCERCIRLSRRRRFGGKGFMLQDWEPYKKSVLCIANLLRSKQSLLVSTACTNMALLGRAAALPLPACAPGQDATVHSDQPFNFSRRSTDEQDWSAEVTKWSVVEHLFRVSTDVKSSSKLKEKALYALGVLCCGERFPYAKQIVKGLLEMAKDSKEFEIQLEVGESLVLCVEGVNCALARDIWTEPAEHGVKDEDALRENDALLSWLLQELLTLARAPHPHSRQATSIWLLALVKQCASRAPLAAILPRLQDTFMDFLSENSEIVQDVASKGLSLVYQSSEETQRQALVAQLIDQLTSGRKTVAQVTADTEVFEEGQLGTAPTGGNLSTYKELCSLASDLNQPDLLYKFMHLAHHNSVWNSKKGAAFGFHGIALQAGVQLATHLPRIVPRLYRYRFDPTPRIQNSMSSIWHALVPDTHKTVHKYHKEILDDLITNLTSNQWRVRMSCCNGLADLLRGAKSLQESLPRLAELWTQLFRVMDDVHEGTRIAATNTAITLSKLCVRAADSKQVVAVILPVLLDKGITDLVKEVRTVSLQTVSKLVESAGTSLAQFLPRLIPALVMAAGDLESSKLSYLSTALGQDASTQEAVDDVRATAAKHHYTTQTVLKCMPHLTVDGLREMLPALLELCRSPQLGTRVACCHVLVLVAHHLRTDLEPFAGKILTTLLPGTLDRNVTVRKNCADAVGQVAAYAKSSSVEKLMGKLVSLYAVREDEVSQSGVALTLRAVSRVKPELLQHNAHIVGPLLFLAMHHTQDNTQDSGTVEMFEECWLELSPGKETGMRQHLTHICPYLESALDSRSWNKKVQAAKAITTLSSLSGGLGSERERLLRSLLAAAHGKSFEGKRHVLTALSGLLKVKEGESAVSSELGGAVVDALLVECRKTELAYKRHALAALGDALTPLPHLDRFTQIYDIAKPILLKEESGKDSDGEEDCETSRLRREQLIAVKEAAYELLGKAFPADPDTQMKYQEALFSHCAASYAGCTRSTQAAILAAVARVLGVLHVLRAPHPTRVERAAVASVAEHTAAVVQHTLQWSKQSRLRRDALGVLHSLATKLKDLGYTAELATLRALYEAHSAELARDASHEIRAKLDDLKALFNAV